MDGLGHLNELGYVEGEGEQSDWDDVNQQPPDLKVVLCQPDKIYSLA